MARYGRSTLPVSPGESPRPMAYRGSRQPDEFLVATEVLGSNSLAAGIKWS